MTLEETIEAAVRRAVREEIGQALAELRGAPDLPLDTAQAAAEAGVGAKTIREWVASGRLHATKRGRALRIDRADLARAMAGDSPDPRDAAAVALRGLRRAG